MVRCCAEACVARCRRRCAWVRSGSSFAIADSARSRSSVYQTLEAEDAALRQIRRRPAVARAENSHGTPLRGGDDRRGRPPRRHRRGRAPGLPEHRLGRERAVEQGRRRVARLQAHVRAPRARVLPPARDQRVLPPAHGRARGAGPRPHQPRQPGRGRHRHPHGRVPGSQQRLRARGGRGGLHARGRQVPPPGQREPHRADRAQGVLRGRDQGQRPDEEGPRDAPQKGAPDHRGRGLGRPLRVDLRGNVPELRRRAEFGGRQRRRRHLLGVGRPRLHAPVFPRRL